jgi:SAM-dependent methyltransferase
MARRDAVIEYDTAFFDEVELGSRESAAVVLDHVASVVTPSTVLDIGCGTGAWLAEWRKRGVADVVGVDGDYVDRPHLQIPPAVFHPADLSWPLDMGRRFDLVHCLEVAEHLEASVADQLVESVVRHGDLLLFSAAVPGQGGTHHVNEQWPSYWVRKFRRLGCELFDVLRPLVWSDERVEWWYRQNVMLFAKGAAAAELAKLNLPQMPVLDLVHPTGYMRYVERGGLKKQLVRAVTRRVQRLVPKYG